MEEPKDKAFMFDGKNAPQIKACLLHPMKKALIRRQQMKSQEGFEGVWYGLCGDCIERLKKDQTYRDEINKEIAARLFNLRKGTEQ